MAPFFTEVTDQPQNNNNKAQKTKKAKKSNSKKGSTIKDSLATAEERLIRGMVEREEYTRRNQEQETGSTEEALGDPLTQTENNKMDGSRKDGADEMNPPRQWDKDKKSALPKRSSSPQKI